MKCCESEKKINFSIDNENHEGLICYCFKYSKSELRKAVRCGNEQQFVNEVKAKMKNPGCFCETANPSGKCCLGDINGYIEFVKKEL